jgi:divalent metal cation (Fe/Co/Zn/Cd) transporter
MKDAKKTTVSPAVQRAAQVAVAAAGLVLLACWGLTSMTTSLALYATGWVAAVGGASSAALLYGMWTVGRPELRERTQTMTLGLVGWLIVIGLVMTLFRAAASAFVEAELGAVDWAVWLLPIPALLSAGAWFCLRRTGQRAAHAGLQQHAPQFLVTAAALGLAEAGLIVAQLGDDVTRWPDVLAAVAVIGVGAVWSWLRLWRHHAASSPVPERTESIDPELSGKARTLLDTARENAEIRDYDRLAIEPSPAGSRLTVRLHLDGGWSLRRSRETARQLERSLEALMPAGSVDVLLEAASGGSSPAPQPEPAPPAPDAGPKPGEATAPADPDPDSTTDPPPKPTPPV